MARQENITSKHLGAALLDQKVAGAFQGKTYCFVAVVAEPGWVLGVAVANERGYNPTTKTFDSEFEAREWENGLNEHIGLTDDKVARIVTSTMGGRPYNLERKTA